MTKQELVRHLNRNANRVNSWRSTHVQISTAGMPIKMSAVIAVEQPRNFRLRAGLVTGNEADLGSNRDRFWFWMRRSPDKYVLTSSHEQAGHVQQMMKFPFQPDWLMQTLGVIPLDESQFVMHPATEPNGVLSLVGSQVTQAGESVRRVILVDTCRGYIIAHELYDARNRLVARAELNDYQRDPNSGASLPHRIDLDWPQARLALTMRIGTIEVNPAVIPEQTWQLPHVPGYPVLDLGRLTRHAEPAGRARVSAVSVRGNGTAPAVRQTAGGKSPAITPDRIATPAGHPTQTAEVPPWDDELDSTRWQPRSQRSTPGSLDELPGSSAELMAHDSADEPPWDDGSADSTSRIAEAFHATAAPGHADNAPARYASLNEEPPWDVVERAQSGPDNAKPASVLDFIKAPFARFARRQ